MNLNDHIMRTERLLLCPQGVEYLNSTHEYSSDAEHTKYMLHLPNKTIEETRDFLQKARDEWNKPEPEYFEFAIMLGNKHIGGICLYITQERTEGELGWIIHKDYQGFGYVPEAALALLDFGFEKLKLRKIYAQCDARNTASRRVMEKIGLQFERDDGIRYDKFTGEKVKELMYSMKNEKIIVAETERLIITHFDESMAIAVHLLSLDEANRRFQPDEVFETEQDALETIQYLSANYGNTDTPQVHPIILKESGENIGHAELVPLGDGAWEIGYHIGEKFTRKGYASEAVKAFLPAMMKKFGLSEVLGICDAENIASRKLMERCGFKREYEGMGMYHGKEQRICRYRYSA